MPSGRVHDRITGYLAPVAGVGVGAWSQRWELATLTVVTVLVSGYFLSPDLDIQSRPYQRWGLLRWLWWPYQKVLPHRSFFSHGPIIGTGLRLVYLGLWLGGMAWGISVLGQSLGWWQWSMADVLAWLQRLWHHDYQAWVTILLGLEVGAMGHYLSDFVGSWLSRKPSRKTSHR